VAADVCPVTWHRALTGESTAMRPGIDCAALSAASREGG
jgi:hypothetical protein